MNALAVKLEKFVGRLRFLDTRSSTQISMCVLTHFAIVSCEDWVRWTCLFNMNRKIILNEISRDGWILAIRVTRFLGYGLSCKPSEDSSVEAERGPRKKVWIVRSVIELKFTSEHHRSSRYRKTSVVFSYLWRESKRTREKEASLEGLESSQARGLSERFLLHPAATRVWLGLGVNGRNGGESFDVNRPYIFTISTLYGGERRFTDGVLGLELSKRTDQHFFVLLSQTSPVMDILVLVLRPASARPSI